MTDRDKLKRLLESSVYDNAVKTVSNYLHRNLIASLGGSWSALRKEYGLYTIKARPKETDRTLQKFDNLKKDNPITSENFYAFMPDLAAARLLIVDPTDIFPLAEKVRRSCVTPVFESAGPFFEKLRLRHGRLSAYNADLIDKFRAAGYVPNLEEAGYCSVHFVFRIGEDFFSRSNEECIMKLADSDVIPKCQWHVEIQIRTLMEEAWGETDHFVRYANPEMRKNPAIKSHFAALSGYLQAANYHVSLIRELARNNNHLELTRTQNK